MLKHSLEMKNLLSLSIVTLLSVSFSIIAEELIPNTADAEQEENLQNLPISDPKGNMYFPANFDNWYGKHLLAMKEPSFFREMPKEKDGFRFYCLPSFSKPICFRAFQSDGKYYVQVTRLTGHGGYDPGKIELQAKVEITQKEWESLREKVTKAFVDCKLTEDQELLMSGLDGNQWVLEGRLGGSYKFKDIWEAGYWVSDAGVKALEELEETYPDYFDGPSDEPLLGIDSFYRACNDFLVLTDFSIPRRMH